MINALGMDYSKIYRFEFNEGFFIHSLLHFYVLQEHLENCQFKPSMESVIICDICLERVQLNFFNNFQY